MEERDYLKEVFEFRGFVASIIIFLVLSIVISILLILFLPKFLFEVCLISAGYYVVMWLFASSYFKQIFDDNWSVVTATKITAPGFLTLLFVFISYELQSFELLTVISFLNIAFSLIIYNFQIHKFAIINGLYYEGELREVDEKYSGKKMKEYKPQFSDIMDDE